MDKPALKWLTFFTVILLFLNGTGALYGGGSLMLDPSGAGLGMPLSLLSPSPFRDYFWPGLILFVCNGLSSLLICLAIWLKMRQAPVLVMFQGVILCGWLIVQMGMLHIFNTLHVVMGITGILLIGLGWRMKKLKD